MRLNLRIIFILLLSLPLHLTVDKNFQVYFDRSVYWYDQAYQSLPISFFVVLIAFFFNIKKIKISTVTVVSLFTLIYLIICTLVVGWHWKLAAILIQTLYFYISCEVIKSIFSNPTHKFLNGWFFLVFGVFLLQLLYYFGELIEVAVYDYDQYAAPFFASFIVVFFLKNNIPRYYSLILGLIYYLFSMVYFAEANSSYISASLVIAILFVVLYYVNLSITNNTLKIFITLFWIINITYLFVITSPFIHSFFISSPFLTSITTRAEIFYNVFNNWQFFLGPLVLNELPWSFSSHSFVFEGIRVFSVFFIFILYFMIKNLINKDNVIGSLISVHAFIVLGLFATPQFHFYTIPLIVLVSYLNWDKNDQ
jgi:hypothetical protein